jgi:hypothetical protein
MDEVFKTQSAPGANKDYQQRPLKTLFKGSMRVREYDVLRACDLWRSEHPSATISI